MHIMWEGEGVWGGSDNGLDIPFCETVYLEVSS